MLADLVGSTKVERVAVMVSYDGTSKFLGAPQIKSSSGKDTADAVYNLLVRWNIADRVEAMSFDTTSSNTGALNGACIILQKPQYCRRELLHLACRHHIYEIVLRQVFEVKLSTSSGPEVQLFERFAKVWKSLDQTAFQNGVEDEIVGSKIPPDEQAAIRNYCNQQLKERHPRNDYREFLQLVAVFLGETHCGSFRSPGATSNARWMAKGIYSLKIFLFRNHFTLTARELSGLRDVCIFLARIYIRAWIGCTNPINAPNQDFNFIRDSIEYAQIDAPVSAAILKKMNNHMWYLSAEPMALAFFDSNVSLEQKRKMVERLAYDEPIIKVDQNRAVSKPQTFANHSLSDFISNKTNNFFVRFGLSPEFLEFDPSTWETNESFKEGRVFCKNLAVVNDTAERGVKFMKDYNRILTNKEDEKQFLLQVVEAYRKKYPSFKKTSLVNV